MLYALLFRKTGFLFFFASSLPLFAGTMEIKIHSDLPIVETENTDGAQTRVAIFNSRSDYGSKAKVWVTIQKKPIPRKEFILVEPPEAEWSHGNVWKVEDVLNDKGEVDKFSKRVTLDKASDWGKEDNFSATVTYSQVREHPLPPKPDGSPADNGPYFAGSDTKTLIVVAPEVSLESITFNHVPGNSDFDGIDLRKNYSDPDVVGPEWTPSGTQPVAYRAGVRPTVKVKFDVRPSRLNQVRAKAEESEMGLCSGIAESWSNSGGGLFPGVKAVSSGIDKGKVSWKWSITGFNGVAVSGWDEIQTTTVPVYKILGRPQSPWKEGAGTQKPWTDALDFAIEECGVKGLKAKKSVIKRITEYLDSDKKWWYNIVKGYPSTCFVSKKKSDGTYEYSFSFSDFKKGGAINCYDSACGVMVTATSLGLPTISQHQIPWRTWYAHCYAVFSRKVYDSCRAGGCPLVVGGDLDSYVNNPDPKGRKNGAPRWVYLKEVK